MPTISEDEAKLVDTAIERLMEHFDSIRIMVTKHNSSEDTTACYSVGRGNFQAQIGQVREWLLMQDALSKQEALNDKD